MALDLDHLSQVRELLKECSAQIVNGGAGGGRGSAFFVDEDLLLTCAHVIEVPIGSEVTVHPFNRKPRQGVVLKHLPGNNLDLALIRTKKREEDEPQPSVLLDRDGNEVSDYYAVGYPREAPR